MKKFLAMTAAALLATTTMASAATLNLFNSAGNDRIQVQGSAVVSYRVLTAEFIEDVSETFLTVNGTNGTPGSTSLYSGNPIIGTILTRTIYQSALSNTVLRFLMGSTVTGFAANNGTGNFGGNTKIRFSDPSLTGGQSVTAFFELGDDNLFDEMSVQISVSEVPVPAAGLLLLSGLAGLGVMRRRKQA